MTNKSQIKLPIEIITHTKILKSKYINIFLKKFLLQNNFSLHTKQLEILCNNINLSIFACFLKALNLDWYEFVTGDIFP